MRYKSLGHLVGREIRTMVNDDKNFGISKKAEKYTIVEAYPHFVIGERKTEDGVIIRETFNRGTLVEMGVIDGGYQKEVLTGGWAVGIRR